jgi:hypothetical protein
MLILQVALGIVLAVLILLYLPLLIRLGVIGVAIVAGLGVLGIALYLMIEYWLLVLFVVISVGGIILHEKWLQKNPIHSIPEEVLYVIKKRSALGYETEFPKANARDDATKTAADTFAQGERERRRSLGYFD